MPARKYNFIIEKGADFQRQLFLKPGVDTDIRLFTARMQIRSTPLATPFLLDLSTTNGLLTCGYGMITINVPALTTMAIDSSMLKRGKLTEAAPNGEAPFEAEGGIAVYDLEIESPSGIVTRYLYGNACFVDNITRE